jgi:hypothetical protein
MFKSMDMLHLEDMVTGWRMAVCPPAGFEMGHKVDEQVILNPTFS